MGQSHDLKQIEGDINANKKIIDLAKVLNKLINNANWKLLIEEEYFVQEAARLVAAKSNISLQSDEQQKFIDNAMIGIGALQQFINKINIMGYEALNSIEADQETLEEILEEGIE